MTRAGKDLDAVVVPLSETQQLVLVSLRRANSDLGDTITGSQGEYRKLVERQRRVRLLGLSTLGLMTLMLLFVSSWVAIYLARGIATPIKALRKLKGNCGGKSELASYDAEDELALWADFIQRPPARR